MKREKILKKAESPINGDRDRDYGDAVKLARLRVTPEHEDSWVDICGYGALGGEE